MTPYFLVPGISVIVEWGWNHFNPLSLLDLVKTDNLSYLFNNPYSLYTDNVLDSKGNYEVVFGIITNFEWSIDGNKIKCRTEITTKDRLWAGLAVNSHMIEKDTDIPDTASDKGKIKSETRVIDSLRQFVDSYVDGFISLVNTKEDDGDKAINSFLNTVVKSNQEVITQFEAKKNVSPIHSPLSLMNPVVMPPEMPVAEPVKSQSSNPETPLVNPMESFIKYIKIAHPDNYLEYLFGIFNGRKRVRPSSPMGGYIASYSELNDWDYSNSDIKSCWINMGLIVEIINYHSSGLIGVKDAPMFSIDIDDCIINAHPNLISTNSSNLLIPNPVAPKYFEGKFGYDANKEDADAKKYQAAFKVTSVSKPYSNTPLDPNRTPSDISYADHRLRKIVYPMGDTKRDDLSQFINSNRSVLSKKSRRKTPFDFPFKEEYNDITDGENNSRKRPAYFTGLLKNLYINTEAFKNMLKGLDPGVFYEKLYEELFKLINGAAANFWDFKITAATGRHSTGNVAKMKIIDQNMTQYTGNKGEKVYTFDYYGADSLIKSMVFRPMLSNAQAIRTIYAQVAANNTKKIVLSDEASLLDPKFKDRLFSSSDVSSNKGRSERFGSDSHQKTMAQIQGLKPISAEVLQMSSKKPDGKVLIVRLAIPKNNSDLLSLLLDDEDEQYNPKYTGIMPNIQAEFTIQGIAGLRTFGMFRVRGLPDPYSEENIVFRIVNVQDTIQGGQWVTNIVAGIIPLRGYMRDKLGLPPKEVPASGK
jgi:hypothetical protein